MRQHVITLLSDFGTTDNYVGVMKGVILKICATAQIIDITHGVPPQDVAAGAFLLERSYRYFPPGTIHVAVVDPGVGTERRGLAVRAGEHTFIAPDNGLLTGVLETAGDAEILEISNTAMMLPERSGTFHGRDVFAPVAAHVAAGGKFAAVGFEIEDPVRLPFPPLDAHGKVLLGSVIYVDHFGNLVTNLSGAHVAALNHRGTVTVSIEGRGVGRISPYYAGVVSGQPVAVVGGFDRLEISVRDGNAKEQLGVGLGARVMLAVT